MKKRFLIATIQFIFLSGSLPLAFSQASPDNELVLARRARDRAAVTELQKLITKAKANASRSNTAQSYVRLALLYSWLCEAIESSQKTTAFKSAAQAGVAAAEKAVALNSRSSQAHQLLGDLLNQLIPHVLGGGMRYGKRATDAMDKAIELDPRNVNAYVSRAISDYYAPPEAFGGGKAKAIDMLKKAVEIDQKEDGPHIWLAMFYLENKQMDDARREISIAREINPDRVFTNYVFKAVTGSADPAVKK